MCWPVSDNLGSELGLFVERGLLVNIMVRFVQGGKFFLASVGISSNQSRISSELGKAHCVARGQTYHDALSHKMSPDPITVGTW